MEQEEKLCDGVETVREFAYLGSRVSAGEECEAAITVRTMYGWIKLQHEKRFLKSRNDLFIELCKASNYVLE